MKTLVVGEAPGRLVPGGSPITGEIAERIVKLSGITMDDYLVLTERVNLFQTPIDRWDYEAARFSASIIRNEVSPGQRVVLLGTRVAQAFGVHDQPLYGWFDFPIRAVPDWAHCIRVPHPSGRNRMLNDPKERERFGIAFAGALEW